MSPGGRGSHHDFIECRFETLAGNADTEWWSDRYRAGTVLGSYSLANGATNSGTLTFNGNVTFQAGRGSKPRLPFRDGYNHEPREYHQLRQL